MVNKFYPRSYLWLWCTGFAWLQKT